MDDEADDENKNRFLKPTPMLDNFVPVAEDESSAFRSLDKSDPEEEDDGFFKTKGISPDFKLEGEGEDESAAFRSLGGKSEDEEGSAPATPAEKKKDEATREELEPVKPKGTRYTALTSESSAYEKMNERSAGKTFLVDCGCCECCPYHKDKQRGEAKPSKSRQPKKKKGKRATSRSKSIAKKKSRKTRNQKRSPGRRSEMLRRLFANALPNSNDIDEGRFGFVCSEMVDALFESGALNERDGPAENDGSEN